MSIKVDLLENDLPREKLLSHSASSITDTELLSILIGSGNAKESAIQIADNLLHKAGNCLHELSRYSFSELSAVQGLGPAKCSTLLAAFELGRRKRSAERKKGVSVGSSAHAFEIFHQHLSDLNHEEMWVLFLSRNNQVIKLEKVSEGGFSGTVVDPKRIFHLALQHKASQLIIAHNHPSEIGRAHV